jgi:hypothetical protein
MKEMEKVFVGVVAGAVVEDVTKCASSALDFIYYAQFRKHSDKTLAEMDKAFDNFHSFKDIFIRLGIREHFNIPKLHALVHYIPMIRSLGCADGYNTEASERLHIDYAKDAYRASNRKAYTQQMTKWLSRQEAADQFDAYLQWRSEQDHHLSLPQTNTSALDDLPATHDGLTSPSHKIRIASKPPLQKVSLQELADKYGAKSFIPALQTYLESRQDYSGIRPSEIDKFNLYKSFDIRLAPVPVLSETSVAGSASLSIDKVRATPSIHGGVRIRSVPAGHGKFDTVLVKVSKSATSEYTEGTALSGMLTILLSSSTLTISVVGLCVAQVRVIFDLPQHFLRPYAEGPELLVRLAYIEWFRPFRRPESTTGMFLVTRASRNECPVAGIIPLDHIVGTCHLVPRFGTSADASWTHENILMDCKRFYLNPWINIRTFYLLRCT